MDILFLDQARAAEVALVETSKRLTTYVIHMSLPIIYYDKLLIFIGLGVDWRSRPLRTWDVCALLATLLTFITQQLVREYV